MWLSSELHLAPSDVKNVQKHGQKTGELIPDDISFKDCPFCKWVLLCINLNPIM